MAARFTSALIKSTRMMSTSAEFIRAPIQVFGIEGRYAHALYSAAVKADSLQAVEDQLNGIQGSMNTVAGLKEFLVLPVASKEVKKEVLSGAFAEAGISPLVGNMVDVMIDNNRVSLISEVVSAFNTIMAAERKEVPCTVTSAHPLSEGHLEALQASLGSFLAEGEKLLLETKTDASLIGGMVVEVGDKRVDMSTATKIKKLKAELSLPL